MAESRMMGTCSAIGCPVGCHRVPLSEGLKCALREETSTGRGGAGGGAGGAGGPGEGPVRGRRDVRWGRIERKGVKIGRAHV